MSDPRNEVVVYCRRGLMVALDGAFMSFENLFRVVLREAAQAQRRKCMLRLIDAPMEDCFNGRIFLCQKTFSVRFGQFSLVDEC